MNTFAKITGAFFGLVALILAVMFSPVLALVLVAAAAAAIYCARVRRGSWRHCMALLAAACAMICGVSAMAGIVHFQTENVIYLDSTGTNGCGFVNGNLVTKRGETYTTNQNLTLIYTSSAGATNSATFVNGVLTSTNHVNP